MLHLKKLKHCVQLNIASTAHFDFHFIYNIILSFQNMFKCEYRELLKMQTHSKQYINYRKFMRNVAIKECMKHACAVIFCAIFEEKKTVQYLYQYFNI